MKHDDLVEKCAEAVHKAYCDNYFARNASEYWTRGDYSLLNEETKEIDRATVRAVLKMVNSCPRVEIAQELDIDYGVGKDKQ